ncbi:hypothetical protein ACXZ9C_11225 [Streptococcus agalactiae]
MASSWLVSVAVVVASRVASGVASRRVRRVASRRVASAWRVGVASACVGVASRRVARVARRVARASRRVASRRARVASRVARRGVRRGGVVRRRRWSRAWLVAASLARQLSRSVVGASRASSGAFGGVGRSSAVRRVAWRGFSRAWLVGWSSKSASLVAWRRMVAGRVAAVALVVVSRRD